MAVAARAFGVPRRKAAGILLLSFFFFCLREGFIAKGIVFGAGYGVLALRVSAELGAWDRSSAFLNDFILNSASFHHCATLIFPFFCKLYVVGFSFKPQSESLTFSKRNIELV